MLQTQSFVAQWLKAFFSLTLTLILFIGYPSQALAQNNQSDNPFYVALEQIKYLIFPPTKLGAPVGRVRGAAGRGRCPALASVGNNELGIDEISLTALVPTKSNPSDKVEQQPQLSSSQIVWGKTVEAYPTFWFYLPYQYEESKLEYAKFVLLDEEKHIFAKPILVKLPDQGRRMIARFTLPKNEKPLEMNKQYNWYFSIICDARKPSRNPSVTGWIQRVGLPILKPQNYMYYAQSGIWYDTVTHLVESTHQQTQSPRQDWVSLLKFMFKEDTLTGQTVDKIANDVANVPIIELFPDS